MKFQVVNIEPPGFPYGHFLDDFCKLLCYGLESLGHACSITRNNVDPSRLNILVGSHLLRSEQDVINISQQARYIVLQSEIIRSDGVNISRNRAHLEKIYLPLLRRASAVWDNVASNVEALGELDIPATHLLGGYHPAMEEIVSKRERDIDFLFYGSITPHRKEMLQALKDRGYSVAVDFDGRSIYRNDLIARSKVALSPRQGGGMDHLPWWRICYLLNNRALVAVERCHDQQWLEHCFSWSDTRFWIDLCEQTLLREDREQIRLKYYEQYRAMPFVDRLAEAVDQLAVGAL